MPSSSAVRKTSSSSLWLSRVASTVNAAALVLGVVLALVAWRGIRLWRRTRTTAENQEHTDTDGHANANDALHARRS